MTPPGHASRLSVLGNETELGFTIPRDVHESPLTRSRRPLLPETSIIPRRRIRQTNSYTHPRKKHKATSGSISRSYSVATREKGSAISFSPGGSLKQDSKLVCSFFGHYMRCEVHSTRRCFRRRLLQDRVWDPSLRQGHLVGSRIS